VSHSPNDQQSLSAPWARRAASSVARAIWLRPVWSRKAWTDTTLTRMLLLGATPKRAADRKRALKRA
jgi:hypothetical protein